jgi:hypothetical protein
MTNHALKTDDLQQLLRIFPDVPVRIVAAVLAEYTTLHATPGAAVQATHDRLLDALALG